ncbi:MAG TPA: glucose 1-dehydrogenase [Chloroflexota bacterium]|jgi:NAD(P)-dependent dehydrogenase (short-subunit alcohol dehydrogenase family)
MAGRLTNKVAIVTGAGSRGPGVGNGEATAILFAREGARVLCVDAAAERAERTCATITAEGDVATPFVADVTQSAQCAAMVAAALERYGRLDVLHNNVGIVSRQGVREITEDEWDRVMAVNLKSMVLSAQAALPALEAAGGGAIVNVASIAALRHLGAPTTAYTTSKAGIVGLTIALAGQLGEKRIRVNCIAPGMVWTPLVAELLPPEVRERRRQAGMIQDEGTAWDVGWAAVYLASDEARWVTGHVLVVDAGVTLTMRESDGIYGSITTR